MPNWSARRLGIRRKDWRGRLATAARLWPIRLPRRDDLHPECLATTVAPCAMLGVPPATISQMPDELAVRTSTPLAPSSGPSEPNGGRELGPIDGIEEAVLRPDRHQAPSVTKARAAGRC